MTTASERSPDSPRRSRRRRKGARHDAFPTVSSASPSTLDTLQASFMGCPRCSYFLAAYRARYGLEQLRTALANSERGWVVLPWRTRDDLQRTLEDMFGYRLTQDIFHFEGMCPECRRVFAHHGHAPAGDPESEAEVAPEEETSSADAVFSLRVQLTPHGRA